MLTLNDAQLNTALLATLSDYGKREIHMLEQEKRISGVKKTLLPAQEKMLAERLLVLPQDAFSAIMGIHYFGFLPEQVNRLFGMNESTGIVLFYTKMLSGFMGLPNDNMIDEDTMERACNIAMRHYFRDLERRFRPSRYTVYTMLRWVAAMILILSALFATRFSVDAAFRERVVSWVMERFEKYSELRPVREEATETLTDNDWDNAYVPARFALSEEVETDEVSMYTYLTTDGETLTVLITTADSVFQVDTEDKQVKEYSINGIQVMLIEGDDSNQAIFQHKGHQFDIVGHITDEEIETIISELFK